MKHLFNGDAAADVFRAGSPDASVIVWNEALAQGPAPQVDGEAWIARRAAFLADYGSAGADEVAAALRDQESRLREAVRDEDLLIWVEADLSCQLTVAAIAQRLLSVPRRDVWLVSVGEFAGRPEFRGLGELTPAELCSLEPSRRLVSQEDLELYADAWQRYRAPQPFELVRAVSERRYSEQMILALTAHLRRFPRADNGLGSVEETVLRILADRQSVAFITLFREFQNQLPLLGYGDLQLLVDVRRMEAEGWIALDGMEGGDALEQAIVSAIRPAAVPTGRTISYWLGGVEITPDSPLQWEQEGRLTV